MLSTLNRASLQQNRYYVAKGKNNKVNNNGVKLHGLESEGALGLNDTISAIKDAIDKILDDLKVMFTLYSLSKTLGP